MGGSKGAKQMQGQHHVVFLRTAIIKGVIDCRSCILDYCFPADKEVVDTVRLAVRVDIGDRLTTVDL